MQLVSKVVSIIAEIEIFMRTTGKFISIILESLVLSAQACFIWGGSFRTTCISGQEHLHLICAFN
jgi:hypothetical protein